MPSTLAPGTVPLWDARPGPRVEFHGDEDDDHNLTAKDGTRLGCPREECWLCGTGTEPPAVGPAVMRVDVPF